MNEPILLGYYRKRADEDNNQLYKVYLKRTYDLKFINVLYGVQIRSMAKHVVIKYYEIVTKIILRFITATQIQFCLEKVILI
jgi:hypothetical protein